jgi:SAM-dependent methyltransferase
MSDLASQFGNIDVYLFDQLLRGRLPAGARVLDAGCGGGRNLVYLLRAGYEVFASDENPDAVAQVRWLAGELAPHLPASHFRVEALEGLSFEPVSVDVVICSAVLHFARDEEHFQRMLEGAWRVLAPGGLFFARLASSIGMEARMRPLGGGRFALPDGSQRYLVDEAQLLELTDRLGGTLADPIKTTVVQDQRCMTTWVLRKGGG